MAKMFENKQIIHIVCEIIVIIGIVFYFSQKNKKLTNHISVAVNPGGGWAYCLTLNGAKKLLKIMTSNGQQVVKDHIDQLLGNAAEEGKIVALSFDPPIIMHEEGAFRPDSDIDWEW